MSYSLLFITLVYHSDQTYHSNWTYHSSPQVKTENGVENRMLSRYHIIDLCFHISHTSTICSLNKLSSTSNLLSLSSLPSTCFLTIQSPHIYSSSNNSWIFFIKLTLVLLYTEYSIIHDSHSHTHSRTKSILSYFPTSNLPNFSFRPCIPNLNLNKVNLLTTYILQVNTP